MLNRVPRVVPGTYRAKLTVGGRSQTVSFEVRKDPRLATTPAEYQARCDLHARIRDKLTETHDAITRLRDVRDQRKAVADRVKAADKDTTVAAAANALARKLTVAEEALYQTRNKSPQDPLNYPIRLNNRLSALTSTVDAADTPPTDQAAAIHADVAARIDAQLAIIREALGPGLDELNRMVKDRDVPAVLAKARKSAKQEGRRFRGRRGLPNDSPRPLACASGGPRRPPLGKGVLRPESAWPESGCDPRIMMSNERRFAPIHPVREDPTMPMLRPRLGPTIPSTPLPRRGFLAKAAAALAGLAVLGRARRADAATEAQSPFVGEIMLFAGNFAPTGWALCNGQLLPINQNQALFSLLGTTYGGNGQTTFGLPDLRGRAPIHFGQGPGLSNYAQGQVAGEENHTLLSTEMPAHSHVARADAANGTSDTPSGLLPARNPAGIPAYGAGAAAQLASTFLATAGGSQAHNNMQPYLVINYCIALTGVFPSRP